MKAARSATSRQRPVWSGRRSWTGQRSVIGRRTADLLSCRRVVSSQRSLPPGDRLPGTSLVEAYRKVQAAGPYGDVHNPDPNTDTVRLDEIGYGDNRKQTADRSTNGHDPKTPVVRLQGDQDCPAIRAYEGEARRQRDKQAEDDQHQVHGHSVIVRHQAPFVTYLNASTAPFRRSGAGRAGRSRFTGCGHGRAIAPHRQPGAKLGAASSTRDGR